MSVTTLDELFQHELMDLYSAETQIIKALPEMISEASDQELKDALREHLEVTKEQKTRLEDIAKDIEIKVTGHECQGMKGLIKETQDTLKEIDDPSVKDAAIIVMAQRVEHYEMAAYGGAVAFAEELGYDDASDLLKQTLDEEMDADKTLTGLAEGGLFKAGLNAEADDE